LELFSNHGFVEPSKVDNQPFYWLFIDKSIQKCYDVGTLEFDLW